MSAATAQQDSTGKRGHFHRKLVNSHTVVGILMFYARVELTVNVP